MKPIGLLALLALSCTTLTAQTIYEISAPAHPMAIREGHLNIGGTSPSGGSISANSFFLSIDGQPVVPVLGEFHYSRYPREQWEEQLLKMKAGGVTVVPTYVFWNVHEEKEGQWDWSGNKDLRSFVELCGKVGLWCIVRIGPFDHGEMRNGGLPDWLFTKPLEVRSNDAIYLHYAGLLYDQIAEQIEGLYYQDGGPVIGIQIENEHQHSSASWALSYPGEPKDPTVATYDASITMVGVGVQDKEITTADLGDIHMQTLLKMAKDRGMIAPIYTATGWGNAAVLGYDGIPVTAGYPYPVWGNVNAKSPFCLFKDLHKQPDYSPVRYNPEDYPSFSVEMGAGIQIIYDKRPVIDPRGAEAMIVRCLGSGANAVGYYMYQGGSSPLTADGDGFLSDANPKVSYDFQAPLGEYGLEKPVYRRLRVLHDFLADFGDRLAPMETVLPEGWQDITADDRDALRFCIRVKDGSGFLFLVNFQDHDDGRHDQSARVDVKLGRQTVSIPVEIAKDAMAILPFNFKIGKTTLRYATAQPLMNIGNHYFFFAPEGMPAEYVFADGKRFRPQAGFSSTFQYKGVRITTLTRQQAEEALKLGDKILFTDATVVPQPDGSVMLLSLGRPEFSYTVFSDGKFIQHNDSVKAVTPRYDVKMAGIRRMTVDFKTRPEGDVHEYFLKIDYTGDVAIAFLQNKVVADNLWQGEPWLIGLNRFAAGMQQEALGFYFRPLRPDAPFLGTLPPSVVPDLSGGQQLDIRPAEIIPQYKLTVRF